MSVIVVGLNHRTVPLEMLERVTISATRLPKALHDLQGREHVNEVVVLSTCLRTEIYAVAERFHGAVQDVRNFLCELGFVAPEDIADHLTMLFDEGAVTHLFTVASGVDSAVIGESEILGQVRAAWDAAAAEGTAGPVLGSLFRHALEVGKRARSETAIARGTTSVSHAAVELAADRLGGIEGRRVVVIGAGEMGEGMAVALAGTVGPDGEVLVANRTTARAEALASRVGGSAIDFDQLLTAVADADVVLTSTGANDHLLDVESLGPVLAQRAGRPLLIVDIAVPRDVDPAVAALDDVTLLDMDDIRSFAQAGIEDRRREITAVREIVHDEVARYLGMATARAVAPVIAELHSRAEELRSAELERFRARLDSLDDRQRDAVEALTRGLVAKLLHEPTVRLKGAAGSPRGERLAEAVRALFDLS